MSLESLEERTCDYPAAKRNSKNPEELGEGFRTKEGEGPWWVRNSYFINYCIKNYEQRLVLASVDGKRKEKRDGQK